MPKTSARLLALLSLLQARRDWPGMLSPSGSTSPRAPCAVTSTACANSAIRSAPPKDPEGGYRLDAGIQCHHCCSTTTRPSLWPSHSSPPPPAAPAWRGRGARTGHRPSGHARTPAPPHRYAPGHRRRTAGAGNLPGRARRPHGPGPRIHAREVLRFDYAHRTGTAARPPRQPHHLVTWAGAGTSSPGTSTARTGVPSAPTGCPRTPTGPRFTPRDLPAAMWPPSSPAGSADRRPTTAGPAGAKWSSTSPRRRGALPLDGMVEALGPDRCRVILGSWSWTGLAAASAASMPISRSSDHPNSPPPRSQTSPPATPAPQDQRSVRRREHETHHDAQALRTSGTDPALLHTRPANEERAGTSGPLPERLASRASITTCASPGRP